jgi:hypothetical protein
LYFAAIRIGFQRLAGCRESNGGRGEDLRDNERGWLAGCLMVPATVALKELP